MPLSIDRNHEELLCGQSTHLGSDPAFLEVNGSLSVKGMQDWVLKQGSKTVCQIALKRRIQHIHSSHFLVFRVSNGRSLREVASANRQYLLFRGLGTEGAFSSISAPLKAVEIHPSFHKA